MLRHAIDVGPEAVIDEIGSAELSGRGGAAFPTAVKWRAVADETGRPKHVIANADESEPGTFKDRIVMENDPFALIESLTIAGLATGAENGWIYIRGEYPLATARLRERNRAVPDGGAARRGRHGLRAFGSTSNSDEAPAPTSAARRPR